MPFFEWDNSLSVGVRLIDDQHRQLIDMINMLHEAASPDDRARTHAVFQGLLDYASTHFETEEGLMRQCNYEALEAHLAEHQAFVRNISSLYERFENGADETAGDLAAFMRDWLREHVYDIDMRYRQTFQEHGIT
jgi:hemerythrin